MEPNNRDTVKELPFSVTSKFSSCILPYSLLAIGVFVHERNTIDCIDVKLGCYCTCSDSREGPTDPGGCPPGRLLPTGLSEGHRSRSGSLGEDTLQEPRLQHQN